MSVEGVDLELDSFSSISLDEQLDIQQSNSITEENEATQKTNELSKDLSKKVILPTHPSSLVDKITPPTAEISRTELISERRFPNLAYEVMKLGLAQERNFVDGKSGLNEISSKIERLKEKSQALLTLQTQMTKLAPDKKSLPVTEEIKAHLLKLKEEFGVDLVADDATEISVEKLANIKLTLDGIKSQVQSEQQKHFMDIQITTQQYNSLLDSLKIVMKHASSLMSTILQNTGR